MNTTNILLAVFTACAFGMWPPLAARTGVSKETLLLIISVTLLMVNCVNSYITAGSLSPDLGNVTAPMWALLVCAGIINALGNVSYSRLIVVDNSANYQLLVTILIPVVVAIGNWILNGASLTYRQLLLLGVILVSLYLFLQEKKTA